MSKTARLLQGIDTVNDRVGHAFSFLLLPLMVITTIEVVARYVFKRPTIWAWDVNMILFGAIVAIGGAYNLRYGGHVKVDVITSHLSRRTVAILDVATAALFFFLMVILVWQTGLNGLSSFEKRELMTSLWGPPIYPLKMLIPLAVFLLLLQGLAKLIRDLQIIVGAK